MKEVVTTRYRQNIDLKNALKPRKQCRQNFNNIDSCTATYFYNTETSGKTASLRHLLLAVVIKLPGACRGSGPGWQWQSS